MHFSRIRSGCLRLRMPATASLMRSEPDCSTRARSPQLLVVAVHVVERHPLGGRLDEVHDVVHLGDQAEDVVAIDGRDEDLVQALHHVVGDVVALVLDGLDPRAGLRGGDLALGHLDEGPAPFDGLLRVFLEVVEEGFFPGQKSHLGGLYRRTAPGLSMPEGNDRHAARE